MRPALLIGFVVALFAGQAAAQTADEIVAKYVQNMGGKAKLSAIQSVRSTGKFMGGGGFEAVVLNEIKRPNMVRHELSIQGFTRIQAYDGRQAWRLSPFGGKKDPEILGDEQTKILAEDTDIDGPLVDYAAKGNKVEYVGREEYEGSDVYKLKVTLPDGTVKHYFLDAEYYIPIKIETKQMIRGTEVEFETVLGDYKKVNDVYFPFSIESGGKGSQQRSTVTYEKYEVNIPIADSQFSFPVKK
jgi:outer membrane lipoprotein-sorting protein